MLIETRRLTLREWCEMDVDCYLRLSRDVGYNCFSPPGAYLVRDEEEDYLRRVKLPQRKALRASLICRT